MASYTVPFIVPNVAEDAKQLLEAISNDRQLIIINILAHRNSNQHLAIRNFFVKEYGILLQKALNLILTGEFLRSVLLWIFPACARDSFYIEEAVHNIRSGRNNIRCCRELASRILVEIFFSRSPKELDDVMLIHDDVCGYLQEELEDTSNAGNKDINNFLMKLVTTKRDIENVVNKSLAKLEAKVLREKINEKRYNDDKVIEILVTRNKAQIQETIDEYNKLSEEDILTDLEVDLRDKEDAIHHELCELLIISINCLLYPVVYYEEILRKAIIEKDDYTLTRVVVTRAEVDMQRIKILYRILSHTDLELDIGVDTNHRKMLYNLLGEYTS